MNPADLKELMAKAKQAQSKMAELQRSLATRRVEGSAGGGMAPAGAALPRVVGHRWAVIPLLHFHFYFFLTAI